MSFLESLGLGVIQNEKEMLHSLLSATDAWYNELAEPFIPVMRANFDVTSLKKKQKRQIFETARALETASLLSNQGDVLNDKLDQIEFNHGIPFFSGRKKLREKISQFLESGDYYKIYVYRNFLNGDTKELVEIISIARERFKEFQRNRKNLKSQINRQIARIG